MWKEVNPKMTNEMNSGAVAKEKNVVSNAERWLLPVATAVGIAFDRLFIASLDGPGERYIPMFSAFWMVYLALFCAFNWHKVKRNFVAWGIAGCAFALAAWGFIFDYRTEYGYLTFLVLPLTLMAHAQFVWGEFPLKDAGGFVLAWFMGWAWRPFCAIGAFFTALGSLWATERHATLRKVLIGALIAVPLLVVVFALLISADVVFSYYLDGIFKHFRLGDFAGHAVLSFVAAILFYSFFWNARYAEKLRPRAAVKPALDAVIACVVLGSVIAVYALFSMVQFTYLFGRAGLPGTLTYSEYARQGFSQLIAIAAINLALFGVHLHFSKGRAVRILLAVQLGMTVLMLVSSWVRLGMYVSEYGLTWLRLISAWFIVYIAAVIALCAARMKFDRLPLMAVCALSLLGWFVVLGYASPDALIVRWNVARQGEAWAREDSRYVSSLSDDAFLELARSDTSYYVMQTITLNKADSTQQGLSLSSRRAANEMEKWLPSLRSEHVLEAYITVFNQIMVQESTMNRGVTQLALDLSGVDYWEKTKVESALQARFADMLVRPDTFGGLGGPEQGLAIQISFQDKKLSGDLLQTSVTKTLMKQSESRRLLVQTGEPTGAEFICEYVSGEWQLRRENYWIS